VSADVLAASAWWDLGPWPTICLAWSDWRMFVAVEVLLDLSFPAAGTRLANLARTGLLTRVSEGAYDDGLTGLPRVGPLGAAPGMSTLVKVHFTEVVSRGESAVLALRWEAAGPDGGLFPALDADVSLTPAGEQSTRLSLAGAYRPPLAALGAGPGKPVLQLVADRTVRSLLARLADALARPQEPVSAEQEADMGAGSGEEQD
jgi:carbon monoxide dehydrogenase subunit G